MEIGSFEVVSKTFAMKRIYRNEAFRGMQGNAGEWAEWFYFVPINLFIKKSSLRYWINLYYSKPFHRLHRIISYPIVLVDRNSSSAYYAILH